MKNIIIFEDSSRVDFGGGQKMTLITCDILRSTYKCCFIFADFSDQTRFAKTVKEKYPESSFVDISHASAKSRFRKVAWLKAIWQMIFFFKRDAKRVVEGLNMAETISYVTNKRSLPYAYYLNKKYGIPFIYHVHLAENPKGLYFPVFKYWIRKAQTILCVSNLVKDNIGLEQCELLYNPTLNTKGYKGEKKNSKYVVAYIGSLIPIKGVDVYIKSAHLCPKEIEFRIYGDGILRGELEKLSNGRVIFKGFSNNIIDEYYCGVDIIVVPTILQESLSLVVVDAKSVGLPVVVTKPGGQAEIVQDEVDGFCVSMKDSREIADAILKLVGDKDLYNKMSKASYESSSIFSYEKYKDGIVKTFNKLI